MKRKTNDREEMMDGLIKSKYRNRGFVKAERICGRVKHIPEMELIIVRH